MSDFMVTPDVELSTAQLLERYNLRDEAILRLWAKLHDIDGSRGFYYPSEVDLIDHAHHHLYNLGMSIAEYQELLERSHKHPQPAKSEESPQKKMANQVADEAYEAIELLTNQYGEAIEYMGERIAEHFIDELDLSVMRHLAAKVKQRHHLNGQARPNRFMQAVKAVLKPDSTLLVPKKTEAVSLELEQSHRLG